MTEERVETRHPTPGKVNKPVGKREYDIFKEAIVATLRQRELTHTELVDQVTRALGGSFTGNVSWHVMTVKLDLEARGVLERTRSTPQRYGVRVASL